MISFNQSRITSSQAKFVVDKEMDAAKHFHQVISRR